MARYISNGLKKRFDVGGDLNPLLNYIKADKDLRLEVRMGGRAFVYYRKGKALEIGAKTMKEADSKYGTVPSTDLAINKPKDYFVRIKTCINAWLQSNKDRDEFDTQQGVAASNQDKEDKYIILDMEYQFPRDKIPKGNRSLWGKARFDLLGIERNTGKITFFEVKTGIQSLNGTSGIADHINDFEKYLYGSDQNGNILYGKESALFRKNLETDIRNIVNDKNALGILNNFDLPAGFTVGKPSLVFVFEPCGPNDVVQYQNTFATATAGFKKQYHTIFVSKGAYKLK